MKRIFLFIATNFAIMFLITTLMSILGMDAQTTFGLGILALVWGMGGALISLLLSKKIAMWSVGAECIQPNTSEEGDWLLRTVEDLSRTAGIEMPTVALYCGAPNAFATGAFRNSALVAVSDELLRTMDRSQVRAILGHEIAHVANGDMVTMTLLQGVLNAVVILLSRIIRRAIVRERGVLVALLVHLLLNIVLSLLASMIVMAYSRHREYAADAGSADLLGSPADMISALRALGKVDGDPLPDTVQAFGIRASDGVAALLASHPPIEKRIAALEQRYYGGVH